MTQPAEPDVLHGGPPSAPVPPTNPSPQAAQPPVRRAPVALIGAAAVALLIVAAGSFALGRSTAPHGAAAAGKSGQARSTTGAETFSVHGSLVLTSEGSFEVGSLAFSGNTTCAGTESYTDIKDGTQVLVTDRTGAIVALGDIENSNHVSGSCAFDLKIPSVPAGGSFYAITVGHRDSVQFTEAQLRDGPLLSLGG